jgi:hypothetical protein
MVPFRPPKNSLSRLAQLHSFQVGQHSSLLKFRTLSKRFCGVEKVSISKWIEELQSGDGLRPVADCKTNPAEPTIRNDWTQLHHNLKLRVMFDGTKFCDSAGQTRYIHRK